jgi:hypothetical protein
MFRSRIVVAATNSDNRLSTPGSSGLIAVAIMMSVRQAPILLRPAAVPFSDPAFATIREDFRRQECERRQRRFSDIRRQSRPDNKHGGKSTGAISAMV